MEFLGGLRAKQIAVGRNENNCLEMFYRGMEDEIYHDRQHTPDGFDWERAYPLGGRAQYLTVAQNSTDQTFELVYIGEGGGLYRNRQTAPNMGQWSGQIPFAAPVGSKPKSFATRLSVAPNKDGRLEMFYVGTCAICVIRLRV